MNRELIKQALDAFRLVGKYTDSLTCYASTISEHEANLVDPSVQLAITALEAELAKIEKKEKSNGCKKKLAAGQWWHNCGDTDFGSMPALCTECGGDLKLEQA